ncbi:hypothetical protein ACFP1I_11290 [Dyadobacter subterraneus]|uniref:Lipoprotein n=1 Tax=Dyadobacter subterraneus TaxID=2773304 RepID=A0ABR9WH62_9BACT|nr:hypothetical protein [Dyadobacter subterraneus]MBE9463504.1 hypothetical protein [Dyadobacter subterraneus]
MKKIIGFLSIAGVVLCCTSQTEKQAHTAIAEKNSDTTSVVTKDSTGIKKTDNEWLIIPGKSIGNTKINEKADLVFQHLGKPDGGDAAMGKSVAIWYANHDMTGHSTSIYFVTDMGNSPDALVRQIRVTSPAFKTSEGLGVSSELSAIQQTFELEVAEKFSDSGKQYQIFDAREGIAFEIGPDKKCVSVIVHEAGKPVSGTYLKFRATNQFSEKKN